MKKSKKNRRFGFALFLVGMVLLTTPDSMAQVGPIRFPGQTITVASALKNLEVQGNRTVMANLAHVDLEKEIRLNRTEGSLDEMVGTVMNAAGLGYRLTEEHIIILPPKPTEVAEPRFNTPGIPRTQQEELIVFNGKYGVLPVSLNKGGTVNQEVPTSYPNPRLAYTRSETPAVTSKVALKMNLLYAATLTPNLGIELGLGPKTSLDITGGYNFYDPSSGKHWRHWLLQPEYRWWFCERFNGSFVGFHLLGGQYNFAGIDFPFNVFSDLKDHRYQGEFYGAGLVFGHQWILNKRWSLEAVIGAGYVRVDYDKYRCNSCGPAVDSGSKNYFGPTKAALSFILFL